MMIFFVVQTVLTPQILNPCRPLTADPLVHEFGHAFPAHPTDVWLDWGLWNVEIQSKHKTLLKKTKQDKTAMCTVLHPIFLSEAALASVAVTNNSWKFQSKIVRWHFWLCLCSLKPEPRLSLSHPPCSTRPQHSKSIPQSVFVRDGQ